MPPLIPYNAPSGFDWVTKATDWQQQGSSLIVNAITAYDKSAQIILEAINAAIWRIQFVAPGAQTTPPTPIVVGKFDPPRLNVKSMGNGITASAGGIALRLDFDRWYMRFMNLDGHEICRENPQDIDGLGRLFILPLGFTPDGKVTESFHLRQDEHLFGLGEKFTPLDKRGQRIISWTRDAFGSTSERSHKNIPFLISTQGYGLFIDSGARITWDLGTVSCQSYTITLDAPSLDAYVIGGSTPAEILARYTELTGRAPVPPKWSFGVWMSGTGARRDQKAFEELVQGVEDHRLPVDVLHVDTWWMKWRHYCDFRWDTDMFPDVPGFIEGLHDKGLRLTVWEHPYISIESDLFEIGKREGYFAKRPDGEVYVIDYGLSLAPRPDGVIRTATPETSWNARVAIIDLTNPAAYRWYQDLHRPVLRMGVAAFKTDFGEDVPVDAVFSNGQSGATMHNLYPLLYNQAVCEVTQQEKSYSLVWSRAGTAGNQRYPVCWSGDPAADWDSLACTIRGGLSIGLSGVPFWASDIGGYRGMPSPKLLIRWAQFAMLCSHARFHGDSPREPWAFGADADRIVREFAELRYRLFPYLYSAAHEAAINGLPVIRAMPLAFPEDRNTYDKDLQFMFGQALLIAPIYDESDGRSVYLPEGKWIDYWTGTVYEGGRNIDVKAPLDQMPIFVRGGAIVPTMQAARRIPEGVISPLIIEVYPFAEGETRLYEDEGETRFSYRESSGNFRFTWNSPVERDLIVHFRQFGRKLDTGLPGIRLLDDGTLEVQISDVKHGAIDSRFETR